MLALASVAHADVKAGVDAWSAGDYAKAVAEWRAPAANDDPDALFNLAQAYRLGRGVPVDIKQAEKLYARAAERGHVKAADNYGLLLFQNGRREQAMPFVIAAADRGDPRAQYLLGIAHFNGNSVAKDWVRAYALMTLANGAGLPQAGPAIGQMDGYIPLSERQQAQEEASTMRRQADARRAVRMAAADLEDGAPTLGAVALRGEVASAAPSSLASPTVRVPEPVTPVKVAPSIAAAEAAVAAAMHATGRESPKTAGADYAGTEHAGVWASDRVERDLPQSSEPARITRTATVPTSAPAAIPANGPWKLQLGAFSIRSNADKAWALVADSRALAGKSNVIAPAGRLTKLFAVGWTDQPSAQAACNSLKAGGQACLVLR